MEKQTNEERNLAEQNSPVDVSKLSNEQLQMGIDMNMHNMMQKFVAELKILEGIVGRQVDVRVNAKLPDGRRIHVRVR